MLSVRGLLLFRSFLASYNRSTFGQKDTWTDNQTAGISSSAINLNVNYYEALGIPQKSTQSDIKSAYYELSKQYHPDKNQGCDSSAKKFREITQAYEVLGNYKLRRLYDKGIIHTAGTRFGQRAEYTDDMSPAMEDDPETKFYKSRFTKSSVGDSAGRTPIYDFDEWSRAHYGSTFERRQTAHKKYHEKKEKRTNDSFHTENEHVIIGMITAALMVYFVFVAEAKHDTPRELASRQVDAIESK